MVKYAEIVDGKVVTISFDERTEWPEVPDTTFPGDVDNGDGTFSRPAPPVPTDEERRAAMPPLTARQFRLALIEADKEESDVDTAIAAIPNAKDQARARVEWKHASQFERTHPLITQLAPTLGFTPEQIDALWEAAAQL